MGEIKSAFERAMEKAERLGKASPEEMKRIECEPIGNAVAARYLRGDIADIKKELSQYGTDVSSYILEGAMQTLIRNISLPRNSGSKNTLTKAMDGILALKRSKEMVKEVMSQIEHLFTYYEEALKQTFANVKQDFESRLRETRAALEHQYGNKVNIEMELQALFQEEWRRARAQLDAQYESTLEQHKRQLKGIE